MKRLIFPYLLFVVGLIVTSFKLVEAGTPLRFCADVTQLSIIEDNDKFVRFQVTLDGRFTNIGERNIILLRKPVEVVSTSLALTEDDSNNAKFIFRQTTAESIKGKDWRDWGRSLDTDRPLPAKFLVLTPNEKYSFQFSIILNISKIRNSQMLADWAEVRKRGTLFLRLGFNPWSFNLEPKLDPENLELGNKLKGRWANDGELLLDEVVSDSISVNLSAASGPAKN